MGFAYSVVLRHPLYYLKSGYMPASIYGIQAPFDVPDKHFMAIKLNDNAKYMAGLIKYDKAFGIN